jgi:hypothetical protein
MTFDAHNKDDPFLTLQRTSWRHSPNSRGSSPGWF